MGQNLTTLILIICISIPACLVNQVRAQGEPVLTEQVRFEFRSYWDSLDGFQPYVGGYMTTDYLASGPGLGGDPSSLRVTVSFAGTNKAVIQSDNALAAGIAAQGPDSREWDPINGVPMIDLGYLLLFVLDGAENAPYIQGMVWKCYEYGRNGRFLIWDVPIADLVSGWTWRYPSVLTVDSGVTLEMT